MIQFSASIDEAKRNKDRTLRLKLDTQELSPEDSAKIFELQDLQIWVAMAEIPLKTDDVKIVEKESEGDKKTPSKRLYGRMYVYWKEKGIGGDFETWRAGQLDKIGISYLDKLK